MVNSAATAHHLNLDVPPSEEPVKHKDISNTGQAEGDTEKTLTETKSSDAESKRKGIKALSLNFLESYSENSLGENINKLEVPRWAKSFLSMVSHLTPMLGTLMLLKPLPVPKQVKSVLGLGSMYVSVWGNRKLKDFPKIAIITTATSLIAELTKMPNFLKRSLLGLGVTTMQQLNDNKAELFKNFASRLLQTEIKLNSSLPITSFISNKVNNPVLKTSIKIFGISSIVTVLSEVFRALGWKNNSNANDDSLLSSSGCPICGSSNVGECVSSDIGPAASMLDGL